MVIEKVIIAYLNEHLDVPVYAERPEKAVKPFIVIQKTGSAKRNLLYSATIAFQSYADSMLAACELNEDVKAELDKIAERNANVSAAYLNSDYNYTNTATKEYRYQAVYEFYY